MSKQQRRGAEFSQTAESTATIDQEQSQPLSAAEVAEQLGLKMEEFAEHLQRWLDECYGEPIPHSVDPFISLAEAARQLGVATSTVSGWITAGLLRESYRPGDRYVLRKSEINRFLRGTELRNLKVT